MIYCANCGAALLDDALFCPECGTKKAELPPVNNPVLNVPPEPHPPVYTEPVPVYAEEKTNVQYTPPPVQNTTTTTPKPATPNQFQNFLKISLPDLIKKVIFDPLDGTKKALAEIQEPFKIGVYCILISSLVISLLIYFRIPAGARHEVDFFEYFFKAFLLPVIGSIVVATLSFIVKAINNSQNANYGNEFLTGGIVCLGYALFILLAFLLSYILQGSFGGGGGGFDDYEYGRRRSSGPGTFTYLIICTVFIYLFTITSNALSQSLRSSGVKDVVAFYLSPFLIVLAAYFTIRLWLAILGLDSGLMSPGTLEDMF